MHEASPVINEAHLPNNHLDFKSSHYSDDSDSEVFRFKRRSSLKPQHRKVTNSVTSKLEHQVYSWNQYNVILLGMIQIIFYYIRSLTQVTCLHRDLSG